MANKQKKILLITLQGIGNTILALPVLQALRSKGHSIEIVVSDNGSEEIVSLVGQYSKIHLWHEKKNRILNILELLLNLWKTRYDEAIALCPAGKRENTLLRFVRSAVRRGWRTEFQETLWSFKAQEMPFWDEKKHDVLSNAQLCELSRLEIEEAVKAVKAKLQKNLTASKPQLSKGILRLGLQPFSRDASKAWPMENYEKLLAVMDSNLKIEFVFWGSKEEETKLKRLGGLVKKSEIKAGKNWHEILKDLGSLDAFLGIDSAVSHLAGLAGIPTCILYAYTEPRRTAALGPNVLIFQKDYPCSPCYRFAKGYLEDCEFHLKCIKTISVEYVTKVMEFLLLKTEGSLKELISNGQFSHSVRELPFAANLIVPLEEGS